MAMAVQAIDQACLSAFNHPMYPGQLFHDQAFKILEQEIIHRYGIEERQIHRL